MRQQGDKEENLSWWQMPPENEIQLERQGFRELRNSLELGIETNIVNAILSYPTTQHVYKKSVCG